MIHRFKSLCILHLLHEACVETGLMQQYIAKTSFTAGIESSNAARFKLISRISCGLQHNVMLLGRRSDLWRLQFSRCQKKKKSGAKTNEEGGKPIGWIAQTGSSPKMKRKKSWVLTFSWQFSTFSHPDTVIPIILNCNSLLFFTIKHPVLSLWSVTTVLVTGLNLNHVFGLWGVHPEGLITMCHISLDESLYKQT